MSAKLSTELCSLSYAGVCVCVCVCVHMHACVRVCTRVCSHMHIEIYRGEGVGDF